MKKRRFGTIFLLFACLFGLAASCYRMPTDNDFSVVPITNNPHITKDKGCDLLPNNVGY